MDSEHEVLELVELIYQAAGDSNAWTLVLERLALALRGNKACLHHQDTALQESSFSTLWNLTREDIASYPEYYGAINPLMTTRPHLIRSGAVSTSQMLCPDEIYTRGEYCNDYLRPLNILHCVAATLRCQGANSSNITIFRPFQGQPFGEQELKFVLVLAPHLQRAFQLHTRIQGLERKGNAAAEALDKLSQGVLLLDGRGRVLLVNKAATSVLSGNVSLSLTRQGLVALNPSESRELRSLIQGALATGKGEGLQSGGVMRISRGSYQRPLQLLVTPLKTHTVHIGREVPVAAIFISDPDRKAAPDSGILAQIYGLTPSEARLGQLLASGESLKDAAEALGLRQSTLRSQLKSIFAKTNTNRQSELVRLFLLAPTK